MIINDLDGYYIVFDTKNWNTELDTLKLFVVLLQRNKFNKVPLWHKLCVRYEGDLVGRVAYSLSKREKIAFIEQ